MKFGVYSIRDVRSGFLTPTIEMSDTVAVRNFSHAVMKGDSLLQSFSSEYDLYKIGDFDTDSGLITPITPIEFLVSADSVVFASRKDKTKNEI